MKRKYVPVRWSEEVLERVKKEAGSRGLSISETVGILVRKSLDSSSESGPTIDTELVKKEVDLAIRFGLEPALKAITLLRADLSGLSKSPSPDPVGNGSGSAPEIRPEVVRFLAEKAARIDALLMEVSSKISGMNVADHSERMRRAKIWAEADVKKVYGG